MASTQQSIDIAGIKDGVIILKNGSYRMIMQASAINFSLKSEQEQTSLILQYQSFLNSLHFPIQIVIRSRRLDLGPYIEKVKKSGEKNTNELIKIQIQDYTDFVTKLISVANIMKKSFYVVVPLDPISVSQFNLFDLFFKKTQKFEGVKIPESEFKAHVEELTQRGNIIASGLGSIGLHCFQLSTEEIIELFYEVYNPEESGKERLRDATMFASSVITSKDNQNQGQPMLSDEEERSIDNADILAEQKKNISANLENGQEDIADSNSGKQPVTETQQTQPTHNTQDAGTLTESNNG